MTEIYYLDRLTKRLEKEKVYGYFFLKILYGDGLMERIASFFLLPLLAYIPFSSWVYGVFQKSRLSRYKIKEFIRSFSVDHSEFLDPVDSFSSFNDFFIRKLKPGARPIVTDHKVAVLPADARYLVFPDIEKEEGFWVKGKKFNLSKLLNNASLTQCYRNASMVIARLCPVDYHRFHFPCDGVPSRAKLLPGPLFSVNPMALKRNIEILNENKRMLTELDTEHFGKILYIEVGATYVGSIEQTYSPEKQCAKGEEKGYFSFGGSCLILLFEPGKIVFDEDLVKSSEKRIEVLGRFGQSLGKVLI